MQTSPVFPPFVHALALTLLTVVPLVGVRAQGEDEKASPQAPLFNDLGDLHHPITTKHPMAQRYFDQGLVLVYGFNHHEAIRSFREVSRLDPDCAMGYWGEALALGPNINAPMSDEAVPSAFAALRKAIERAPRASEEEQAYIQALAHRYGPEPVKDRKPLDIAYAKAMQDVATRFPDDLDAATLAAEAVMDTMPWDYWRKDGHAKPETEAVIGLLESVLKRNPDHPGANHYYIHAVEASPFPERGMPAAHRLRNLVPGAGHLVHMPAHIYLRVGQYHEASLANERAIGSDESYITQCRAQGFYPAAYYSHNIHFLWYSASMEGRSRVSLDAARKTAEAIKMHAGMHMPELGWLKATPLFAEVRFGRWDQILGAPEPMEGEIFHRAFWHFARGMAFVRKQQLEPAREEAKELKAIAESKEGQALEMPNFPGSSLIEIARNVLDGELAGLEGRWDDCVRLLADAVQTQDDQPYMEPPYWFYPVRQSLGAALLRAGRISEAESVYREDLERNPHNGWSLFGLLQSLRAQGKTSEADKVQQEFQDAWAHADVTLTASCF